ncbi:MAG: TetR/AcrR family transcriptional regulator [Methanobacterium sp.]|nr:TetR/AcrR family transcriptional regulator [Methanobacterium sp.]
MEEKSFWRKNELIDAALDEFSAHSYQNASLNKIIKNAGISKGKFYYHFEDKKEFYLFLQEAAYQEQIEFQDKRMDELVKGSKLDFFEKIKLRTQIGAECAASFPKYVQFTMKFLNEKESEETKEIIEYVNSFVKKNVETRVEEMVTDAVEAGELSDRFSKEFIIKIVNHFFLHSNEIFGIGEEFDETKFVNDTNNLIDFLKFGLSSQGGS